MPRLAAKRRSSAKANAERPWVEPLRTALEPWTRVTVQSPRHGAASFLAGKKIFAFTRPEGIAMKLPEARIRELIAERDASFLVMGKRTMREWMLLKLTSPTGESDLALLREAMEFAARKKS